MARGHALMGAVIWLGGCAAAAQFRDGHLPSLALVAIGTPVCAGWAIVPDIDHPNSTISRSLGPVSRGVAELAAGSSRLIHEATRTQWDRPDEDGHRTVTHTLIGALVFGAVVGLAGWLGGPWVAALLVFWPAHLGISATLKSRRRRQWWFGRTVRLPKSVVDAAVLAAGAAILTPGSAWWLGLAAGGGAAIHLLGDMMTDSAVPALWPIVLRDVAGRPHRWQPIGLPRRWRFAAGSKFETIIVHRLLVCLSAGVLLLLVWPILATVGGYIGQN